MHLLFLCISVLCPVRPGSLAACGLQRRLLARVQTLCVTKYTQLIGATDDGKAFDGEDAQLALDRGTPRFYIMRLPARLPALTFDRITFHGQVCASCVHGEGRMQLRHAAARAPACAHV